jgi:hypothetical protein
MSPSKTAQPSSVSRSKKKNPDRRLLGDCGNFAPVSGWKVRGAVKISKLLALAVMVANPAVAQDIPASGSLRAQDERLLRIAEPILAGNLALCDRTMPRLGVALQSTDQYGAGQDPGFAAPVGFAAVLPQSVAAQAGIGPGDGLLSVNGRPVVKRAELQASPLRDSAFAAIAEHTVGEPLILDVVSRGGRREVVLNPPAECRILAEILADGGTTARSDGRVIQISRGLAARASGGEIAAIFAHELAHSILRHRDRLSAADVSKGLGGEFGRDRRLNREAEIEADRLSVHLLANAGLDPASAPAFWRSPLGKQIGGGLLRSRVYPSPEARAQQLEREIADYLPGGPPSYPGHLLARRGGPLD